ncbi:unnamed protein product, partial [Meganyctiphanes norvegica]
VGKSLRKVKMPKNGIWVGVGGSKRVKEGQKYQKHNFLVLLTLFTSLPSPKPYFVGLFTFLMLSPTNRSQNFENRTKNECSTDFFVKLPKTKKILKLVKLWILESFTKYALNRLIFI